jgi:hypothetical protein
VAEIKAADIRKLLETIRDGGKDTQPRPYLANRTYAYLKTFFGGAPSRASKRSRSRP